MNSPVILRDPIQIHLMSHALQSAIRASVHAAGAPAPSPVINSLCYKFLDKYLPGLGKKQKANAAHKCAAVVDTLVRKGKKVTVETIKQEVDSGMYHLADSWENDVTSKMGWMTSAPSKKSNGKSTSSVSRGGASTMGGTSYAPVSVSHNIRRSSKPRMTMRGECVTVRHSEMLGAILSGDPSSNVTAFRCFGLRANPGLTSIFPWLSTMAVNYEKYRFRQLRFTIVPLVATSFSGRIGVGFDYDSSDTAPGNRQEFYALTNHAEGMPWEATAIDVRCDNKYRFTGTHVAADNKLIDQGQVILMSDSISGGTIAAAIPLYDLIVDYEVELIEPQQSLFSTQLFQNSSLTSGATLGVGTDATVVTGPSVLVSVVVTSASVLTINFPAGNYSFSCMANWTSGAATATTATSTTNATVRVRTSAGSSFITIIGTLTATSDAAVTVTLGTVAWGTNQNRFNLMVSRVTSSVATGYSP